MLALQKIAIGEERLELREVPEPEVRPGHVVLDVAAAGICGTDLHIMKDEYRSEPPVTLGHEVAGTIAAVGEGVLGWHVGQRVVSETYFSVCGRCESCRTGRPNLCARRRSIGSFEPGGFAKRVLVPATNLHALPDALGFPEAALVEPLACVVRGMLELNDVQAGDRVVITGPGPIGLLALQVAKASGARVVMLGTAADTARLALARRLGADAVLAVEAADTLDVAVADALGGPADVAIECSGAAPAAGLLLRLVKKAGRYVQVGLYGTAISLDMDQVCYKELRVSGSFATTPSSWYRALALAETGAVSLAAVVGSTFALHDWQRAFDAVTQRVPGKVLLIP
ncbi:MAG: zinc-binding dehydrogenase [Trueperaceae bacterium]|nr:zinc-binding dehydrogenase [Trueperaceae bacterium]